MIMYQGQDKKKHQNNVATLNHFVTVPKTYPDFVLENVNQDHIFSSLESSN